MSSERYVSAADGTQLYTHESGAGPAVVLVDGLGCDGFVWKYLEPALAAGHRVVRYHHRGHGRSDVPRDPTAVTLEELLGDLRAVLDAYELQRPILVGHSMGVQLILELCLRQRDRVRALVPICGSYGKPLSTFHDRGLLARVFPQLLWLTQRNPRIAQAVWSGTLRSEIAYRVALRTEVNGKRIRRDDLWPMFEHLMEMDVRAFLGTLNGINAHTTEDQLHRIDRPTLVIGGRRDRFTPAWLSERMHELISGSELLMLPDGSHAAPIERPEEIGAAVARFLEALPSLEAATSEAPTAKPSRRKTGHARTPAAAARAD